MPLISWAAAGVPTEVSPADEAAAPESAATLSPPDEHAVKAIVASESDTISRLFIMRGFVGVEDQAIFDMRSQLSAQRSQTSAQRFIVSSSPMLRHDWAHVRQKSAHARHDDV